MPCNSEYLDPTHRERELRRAAQLAIYVLSELKKPVPGWVIEASKDIYCDNDDTVPYLCGLCKSLTVAEEAKIIYNAYSKTSRELADWWEEHLEADRRREQAEKLREFAQQEEVKRKALAKSALGKLTKEERKALGI